MQEQRRLDQLQLHDPKLAGIIADDVDTGVGRFRRSRGERRAGQLRGAVRDVADRGLPAIVRLDAEVAVARPFDHAMAEHVIEHVPFLQAMGFFRECVRVLRPGGEFLLMSVYMMLVYDIIRPFAE